jgi:DHA1 family tetracycline resistance protein-like MFS transporter
VQGGLVGLFTRKLGEYRSALLGLVLGSIGFCGYALADTPTMLFASVPLACLIGLAMPSMRALLSQRVPANAQGELQGAISGIVGFTAIVTPFSMTHVFSLATSGPLDFPGAPFALAAVSLLAGAAVLATVARRSATSPHNP